MKKKRIIWFIAATIVGLSLGYLGVSLPDFGYTFKGALIEPPVAAQSFSLFDQHGEPFTLEEQRGKVVLLFFGYTNCPDVCPATLGKYKQIAALLGEDAQSVRFIMITADPRRDTPDKLGSYVTAFNPDFIGLWGPEHILEAVYANYWVGVEEEPVEDEHSTDYLVAHTSRVFLVDPEGMLRLTYPGEIGAEAMADDIAQILKTSGR